MSVPIPQLLRAAAHVLLSGIFVVGGLDAARHPDTKVDQAKAVTDPLANKLPVFPNTATVVRLNGVSQVAAAIGLAIGPRRRIPALGLAASLVPTTLAGHRFWDKSGDERSAQLAAFLTNAAVLGGLLLVAVGDEENAS